jgi:hypothetical protein
VLTSSFGLASLDLLYKRFLAETDTSPTRRTPFQRRNELSETDLLAELRTQKDLTVLKRFPQLKARLGDAAAAVSSSTSWLSSFAPIGFQADLADVIKMLRVHLLVEPVSPAPCFCGRVDPGDGTFQEHVLTCSHIRGATRTYRHNLVLAAMHNSLQRFGLMSVVEPRFYEYDDGKRKRPDLTVFKDGLAVTTDLVISHDPDAAVKYKIEKHAEAAAHRGHLFIPTAMSIFGSFHPCVHNFLRKAFAHLTPQLRWLATLQTMRVMSEAWLAGTTAMLSGIVRRSDATLEFGQSQFVETTMVAVERLFSAA